MVFSCCIKFVDEKWYCSLGTSRKRSCFSRPNLRISGTQGVPRVQQYFGKCQIQGSNLLCRVTVTHTFELCWRSSQQPVGLSVLTIRFDRWFVEQQQAASLVGPAVYSFLLYDGSKANINTYVRVVTFAFTWGYLITFALEIVAVSRKRL